MGERADDASVSCECMRDLVLEPQTFRVAFRAQAVFLTRLEFRLGTIA